MEPITAALLVLVFGLTITVIGVAVMVVAHIGRHGRSHMTRGLVTLLYGAWGC